MSKELTFMVLLLENETERQERLATSFSSIEALAECIKSNNKIKSIIFTSNNLKAKHIKILALALKENNSVEELVFRGNKYLSSGFDQIIKNCKNLIKLDLSDNVLDYKPMFGDDKTKKSDRKAFWKALKENHTITELNLGSNTLTLWDFEQLRDVLRSNKTLLNINWQDNHAITELLQQRRKIRREPQLDAIFKRRPALANIGEDCDDPCYMFDVICDQISISLSKNQSLVTDLKKRMIFVLGLYEENKDDKYNKDAAPLKSLIAYRKNRIFDRRTVKIIFYLAGITANPKMKLDSDIIAEDCKDEQTIKDEAIAKQPLVKVTDTENSDDMKRTKAKARV